ncbi:MAG: hypothetical protein WDZ85_02135 [Candidatus Paceibacterota bacterium]
MVNQVIIEKILADSYDAPSGGNSQPWYFEIKDNTINIFAQPEKDHAVLNVRNRGTYIAHGALIENIAIASTKHNLKAIVKIFPNQNEPKLTASIELIDDDSVKLSPLYSYLHKRASNRKPYAKEAITENVVSDLKKYINFNNQVNVNFIYNRTSIDEIAKYLSVGERIMFENKFLNRLFFKELVWNKNEEKLRGGGLLIHTLELSFGKRLLMRLLKYWPIMSLALKLGIAKKIAAENKETHSACAGLCIISAKLKDSKSFIDVGRQVQSIWLAATKNNLSVQLNSGLLFFHQAVEEKTASQVFTEKDNNEIKTAYHGIESICRLNGIITTILRIGYDGEPSAKSTKLLPKINYR